MGYKTPVAHFGSRESPSCLVLDKSDWSIRRCPLLAAMAFVQKLLPAKKAGDEWQPVADVAVLLWTSGLVWGTAEALAPCGNHTSLPRSPEVHT